MGECHAPRTRRSPRLAIVTLVVAATFASASTTLAQQPRDQPPQDPTWVVSSGTSVTLFPSGDVYPVYAADPHRPTNVLAHTYILGGGIFSTASPVIRLSAGGRFGMLRIGSTHPGGRAVQVSIEAGLDALFDAQHRLDVAGWDGNYGLVVTTASSRRLALKVAVLHVSAHVGDEFELRTGVGRSTYTREELSVGVLWRFSPNWRAYGETGVAYRLGDPALEPWRAQSGIEFESDAGPCGRRIECYAALNVSTMQERNWRLDTTANAGLLMRGLGRTTRIFLEWHDGRPTVNHFFNDSVTSLTCGLKIDL
jgi:hypothetical protein